jgi:hypothetical protein
MMGICRELDETIGDKPLARPNRAAGGSEAAVSAKVDSSAPEGNAKDCIGAGSIEPARGTGLMEGDVIVLERTSVNVGVGRAFVYHAMRCNGIGLNGSWRAAAQIILDTDGRIVGPVSARTGTRRIGGGANEGLRGPADSGGPVGSQAYPAGDRW